MIAAAVLSGAVAAGVLDPRPEVDLFGAEITISLKLKKRRRSVILLHPGLVSGPLGVSYERATSKKNSFDVFAGVTPPGVRGFAGILKRYPAGKAPAGFFYGGGLIAGEGVEPLLGGSGFVPSLVTAVGYKIVWGWFAHELGGGVGLGFDQGGVIPVYRLGVGIGVAF